jgi:hypothetical protein
VIIKVAGIFNSEGKKWEEQRKRAALFFNKKELVYEF